MTPLAALPSEAVWAVWVAVAATGAALSFVFSGLETGVYVLNKIRLDLRAEAGSRSARMLRQFLADPSSFLTVVLVGNGVVNYVVTFAISAMFLLAGYGEAAEWYALAVATTLLFVFCESLPKNLFRRMPEKLVYPLAWVLRGAGAFLNAVGLLPLVRGYSSLLGRLGGRKAVPHRVGQRNVGAVLSEGRASGVLTHVQSVMADRVMHIADVRLAEVMIPMKRVVSARRDVTRAELVELLRGSNFSHVPLTEGGKVVGVLDIYEFLIEPGSSDPAATPAAPAEKMRLPFFLSYAMTVTDTLYHMQREKQTMAIIKDDPGNHVGIVTIKDLVEEIVGELAEY